VFDNVRHYRERLVRPTADDADPDAVVAPIPDDAWDLICQYVPDYAPFKRVHGR
jgi:hypothetical protein